MTLTNIRNVSDQATDTLGRLDHLVQTNSPLVHTALTDFTAFTRQLTNVASQLEQVVVTNRESISDAVQNVEAASVLVKDLLSSLQEGKGLAGSLLKDQELQAEMKTLMDNLVVLSSNLNRYGLLYKPKAPRAEREPSAPVYRGNTPFR
jgi:ABC-type transporter Mla subunit MlaD